MVDGVGFLDAGGVVVLVVVRVTAFPFVELAVALGAVGCSLRLLMVVSVRRGLSKPF